MGVTPEEVRRIAALARLRLEAGEVERMSAELSGILDHVRALEGVEEDATPSPPRDLQSAPLRADGGVPDTLGRLPDQLAPAWTEPFFVVPRLAAMDADAAVAEGSDA